MESGLRDWGERLGPLLAEEGIELLEAQSVRGKHSILLRFFVDREAGIGVDDLARLSRKIGLLLDADPVLTGRYALEVSSPGMNRIVRTEEHFRRFTGERVHIWTRLPRGERRHFEGTILGAGEGIARVEVDAIGPIDFGLGEIERAELRLDPRRPPHGRRSTDERGTEGEGSN